MVPAAAVGVQTAAAAAAAPSQTATRALPSSTSLADPTYSRLPHGSHPLTPVISLTQHYYPPPSLAPTAAARTVSHGPIPTAWRISSPLRAWCATWGRGFGEGGRGFSTATMMMSPVFLATLHQTSLQVDKWVKTQKSFCGLPQAWNLSWKSAATIQHQWRFCSGHRVAASYALSAAMFITRSSSTSSLHHLTRLCFLYPSSNTSRSDRAAERTHPQ